MKVCHTLICFFFLSLWDGNTGFIDAQIRVRTGSEGANITVRCSFSFPGSRKIFCKRECEGKDILIETEEDRAQSGRYSIKYEEGNLVFAVLNVGIINLTKSDSGRYRCMLDRRFLPDLTEDFELRVEDAPTASKPNRKPTTKAPFTPSVPSASTPTTTQTSAAGPGVQLYVRLTVVVTIIVLSASALIFCRKRAKEPKEPAVEYVNVTEARIREEDTQSRSPPEEISTVYIHCSQFSE